MNKILRRAFENFFINKTSPYLYNTRGNPQDVSPGKTTYGSNTSRLHAICT